MLFAGVAAIASSKFDFGPLLASLFLLAFFFAATTINTKHNKHTLVTKRRRNIISRTSKAGGRGGGRRASQPPTAGERGTECDSNPHRRPIIVAAEVSSPL